MRSRTRCNCSARRCRRPSAAKAARSAFVSTTGKFAQTLDILADMILNSDVPRRCARAVARAAAGRADAGEVAARGDRRPRVSESALRAGSSVRPRCHRGIDQGDHARRHRRVPQEYFQPGRALVTVVGDVTAADVKPVVDKALAAWPKAARSRPRSRIRPCRRREATTIYLVDKPGAAQSTFAIGDPGPPRNTPDFYALQVMNTILGGLFQSRLNANIREEKGYSYGVSSSFAFGKGPGPFRAGGDIVRERPTPR